MLPILPEESPSPDWRQDREPLPEAVVAGVPPALWLIPQPTRLPLQKTRKALRAAEQFGGSNTIDSAQCAPGCRSTTCRSAASFCPDSRRRLSPPSCQARFCQKSSSALRLPRKILRSALRMLAILVG